MGREVVSIAKRGRWGIVSVLRRHPRHRLPALPVPVPEAWRRVELGPGAGVRPFHVDVGVRVSTRASRTAAIEVLGRGKLVQDERLLALPQEGGHEGGREAYNPVSF